MPSGVHYFISEVSSLL
uniref:Uncharacterized protein n=1 Tax=Rhizophora mucronata TaxID=61149 RepID=A0A2P2P6B7_RHIMU